MYDQKTVEKENIIKTAEGPNLWWLFWLLLVLVLLVAIIVLICCLCECCPWYIPLKRKKVQSAEVAKLVVRGSGQGKESKSVQVAEWFGRREAWTPEAAIDNEIDSLRRHEMERGSDRGGVRRVQRQNHATQDTIPRDQLYIREGNADILRLITRGNEQQRPITLVQEQPYIIDSGKDILLRRFIDQQQTEVHRPSVVLPNTVNKLQAENEMLEASLRHQNAILRQILTDREREMRLETQSLPAGTQTDQDAGTQTEPIFLRPPKRKTRSDNDASDFSDEEDVGYRRRYRRHARVPARRKINTPIQEESETNIDVDKQQKNENQLSFGHTRTSLLRKKAAEKRKSKSALRREVLREISATLLQSDGSESDTQYKRGSFSDDSLEDRDSRVSRRNSLKRYSDSSKSDSLKTKKYHSTSDLRSTSVEKRIDRKKETKSQSQVDLTKKPKKTSRKSIARYMEWYNKSDGTQRKKSEGTIVTSATSRTSVNAAKIAGNENQAEVRRRASKSNTGPEHPLLQHSEHRFEVMYPRRLEDDVDSGIALTRPPMAQKKSVFTIAYDDMQTRHIRQNSATPPV